MNNPVGNRVRIPIEPAHGVSFVSKHAVDRFIEKSGSKGRFLVVADRVNTMLANSKPAYMDPIHRVQYMLRHDCQPANLRLQGQWVFVIEGDTIVTIHENERGHVKKGSPT